VSAVALIVVAIVVIVAGFFYYQKNNQYTDWETYTNEKFQYEISYPEEKFILETEFGSPTESGIRDIGILELREQFWKDYSDIIKPRNPKVSWIVNLNTDSINDECNNYSSAPGATEETISGKKFTVREVVSSDDIGYGGAYNKVYNYKGNDRCFLIWTGIGLRNFEANSPKPDTKLNEIQEILKEVVKTFSINNL